MLDHVVGIDDVAADYLDMRQHPPARSDPQSSCLGQMG